MKKEFITSTVQELSEELVRNCPLYSFVTSNPLAGLEHLHFEKAVNRMRKQIGVNGYPSATVFEQALSRNQIDRSFIEQQLLDKGITCSVEASLAQIYELDEKQASTHLLDSVDRHLIKWLTVFMDQGSTEWGMPYREAGFYTAWRVTASLDSTLPHHNIIKTLPKDALQTLEKLLVDTPPDELHDIFNHHLLALPGWTGYIKYRMDNPNEWQQEYPITLVDYLAVRLSLCHQMDEAFLPENKRNDNRNNEGDPHRPAWLKAFECTYQDRLFNQVASQAESLQDENQLRPDAQFVFCIDTRSERIRRAVEQAGNYQTFGYAGFFGVAMEYEHPEKEISHKACPPIVEPVFRAREEIRPNKTKQAEKFNFYSSLRNAVNEFRFTLKNNIPASFGYVESAGFFYGIVLFLKTLMPTFMHRIRKFIAGYVGQPEGFSQAILSHNTKTHTSGAAAHLSADEKTEIAKTAFELMGWDEFAPLVVFAGHGSQTSNNPFGSSLDCGACAGNKGRYNARVLANICNEAEVRNLLAEKYDIHLPDDTWFLAAEHNTTTNYIDLYDQNVPVSYHQQLKKLKDDMKSVQLHANMEQFNIAGSSARMVSHEAHRRASDWAETRPEWGLAGNASFIIGPRALTSGLNLEARSFLHTYDWEKDPNGEKLEAIFQGPMVVTQWINNHYYFAAVDNDRFGSGTKVTHNVTGKYGVVQGNGGDLKSGLPLESLTEDDNLLQHLPLRLTVLVYAPKTRVEKIISEHPESLGKLVKNEWIYLAVLDPEEDNEITFIDKAGRSLVTAGE